MRGIGEYYNFQGRYSDPAPRWNTNLEHLKQWNMETVRLAASLRGSAEPLDLPKYKRVAEICHDHGYQVILDFNHNWKDYAGYFGSKEFYDDTKIIANYGWPGNTILQPFNEPFPSTWAPEVGSPLGVQKVMTRVAEENPSYTILNPDHNIYTNYSWKYSDYHWNAVHGVHAWYSQWAINEGSPAAWVKVLEDKSHIQPMPVIFDEFGLYGTLGSADLQEEFAIRIIQMCERDGFGWLLWEYNRQNWSAEYAGRMDKVFDLALNGPTLPPYGEEPTPDPGPVWVKVDAHWGIDIEHYEYAGVDIYRFYVDASHSPSGTAGYSEHYTIPEAKAKIEEYYPENRPASEPPVVPPVVPPTPSGGMTLGDMFGDGELAKKIRDLTVLGVFLALGREATKDKE